jgi:hypothetical protein
MSYKAKIQGQGDVKVKHRKRSILFFLVVFIMFFAAPSRLHAVDYVFFLSGNYAGGMDVKNTNWSQEKDYWYLVINDSGSINAGNASSFGGTQVGAQLFFTPKIGISLSANFYFEKAEFDLDSSYTYYYKTRWEWENSEDMDWSGAGNMKVTPINLNIVFAAPLFSQMSLNISAGGTYFITKVNMNTNIGYGHAEITEYDWGALIFWDWYILEVENNHSKNFFGGNVGLDLEYKVSPRVGLFIGFQYLFAPKQTFDWELVRMPEYESGSEDEPLVGDPKIANISTEVDFSHYTAGIGIKIHI